MSGDTTTKPDTHVVQFIGETPCDSEGTPLTKIINASNEHEIVPGLRVTHTFSSKPSDGYTDYYDKMRAYALILLSQALRINPASTATPFLPVEDVEDKSPFLYMDTASSRADIDLITRKLSVGRVAIVGIGGTGSYLLDFLSKTPIGEIHLFDGDYFLSHNAFRAPGAASLEELRSRPFKVEYFAARYSSMRKGVTPHPVFIDSSNIDLLAGMDFVFLSMDGSSAKRDVMAGLMALGITFIDVGLGLYEAHGSLGGTVRMTLVSPDEMGRELANRRIMSSDTDAENEYARNIQIAELNAFAAIQAVIKWKKLVGFFTDLEHEYFSAYDIDGNCLTNEEQFE